jgi:hypothetical protein
MAKARYQFEQLDPFKAKGKALAQQIFRYKNGASVDVVRRTRSRAILQPIARPTANTGRPVFGRNAERTLIFKHIASVKSGTGVAVLIEGPAGVGKTRVAEELITMSKNLMSDAKIHQGQADSIDQLTDFLAFQGIFVQMLGLQDDAKKNQEIIEQIMYQLLCVDDNH